MQPPKESEDADEAENNPAETNNGAPKVTISYGLPNGLESSIEMNFDEGEGTSKEGVHSVTVNEDYLRQFASEGNHLKLKVACGGGSPLNRKLDLSGLLVGDRAVRKTFCFEVSPLHLHCEEDFIAQTSLALGQIYSHGFHYSPKLATH